MMNPIGIRQSQLYQPLYALAKKVIPVVWVLVNFCSVPNVIYVDMTM